MKQSYNEAWLSGYKHVTDEKYCKEYGVDPSLAYTPEVNNYYISLQPENKERIRKLLAANGLLEEEN